MSSNFDFLRNFDNDLHYLACVIEDEIYDSPSAVLTDATTFLEIIIYNIFKENELESDNLIYFKDKILFLSELGFLSPELKKNMLKAYSIRNKMHSYNGDAKNHIHLNQLRAVRIHKLLFNVAWLYYTENTPEHFKANRPSYTHPSNLKNDMLIKSELGNGRCIICEGKTASEDELFCRECKYKIEKSDNLKTLRKHFGFKDGFKRNELIEIGFEKGYIGPFIQELKKDDLIYSVGKVNFIDRENATRYIGESESMMSVEKVLSDFKLRNLTLDDILNHEIYEKGKQNQYPFVGFYHLFSEIFHSTFISQIHETSIEDLLEKSYLSLDDLNEWYFKGTDESQDIFTSKLIDEIFTHKRKGMKTDFKITDEIMDEIVKSEEYQRKEDEYLFSSFLKKTIAEKTTKKQALEAVGLSENDLDGFLLKYPDLREKFEKSYTQRKMEKFIKHYDYYNYDYALKKTGLTPEEIQTWLGKGEERENEMFVTFLNEYHRTALKKYIEYRKKGNTRYRALKSIRCDEDTIKHLLDEYDNDLDDYLVEKIIELFKSGKRKDEALKIVDVTPEWFTSAIDRGIDGENPYRELYMEYSKNTIPAQMKKFMELIGENTLKNVLNELDIDKKELDYWYSEGKNSIPPYNTFYEEFIEYKKETYVKTMIKTRSKSKALKKSYLAKEELDEFEDNLNTEILEKSMEIVISELEKGKTTRKAAKKASIKISTIYEWLKKALDGDEQYSEFLKAYKKEYLIPIKHAYSEGVRRGVPEKDIIRVMRKSEFLVNEDVKQLKQLRLFPKPGDEIIELEEDIEVDFD